MKDRLQNIMMNDKALHFMYSFFFTCVLYTFLNLFLPFNTSLGISALAVFCVGVVKELNDEKIDYVDLGFDLMGIVTYIILNQLNNM